MSISVTGDIRHRRREIRSLLIALGVLDAPVGIWILVAPHSFYAQFPGLERHWVSALGAYDEHLIRDFGAALLGLSVLLLLAGVVMRRQTVQIALVSWLAYAIPHFLFHVLNTQSLSVGDNVANLITLAATVVIPVWLLVATRRDGAEGAGVESAGVATPTGAAGVATPAGAPERFRGATAAGPAPPPAGDTPAGSEAPPAGPRIAPRPERGSGPLVRYAYRASRKQLGRVADPIAITAHHPTLLAGYGALELAMERSGRVEPRLKALAELKAATMTGCEFCMDIGSKLGRDQGVSERQLREFLTYRVSDAFSPLERLVIDYAAGMSKTPVDVPDTLFDRLREHFDEAQMIELTAIIALENYRGRFNWALGIGSQGFSDGQVKVGPDVVAAAAASA